MSSTSTVDSSCLIYAGDSAELRIGEWGDGISGYLTCPQCGFFNHPAATVREDDRFSCCNCFHLFLPKDAD